MHFLLPAPQLHKSSAFSIPQSSFLVTWKSLRAEVSLCAMGREVALPCRASFELHSPINQQRILSWGRCGVVVIPWLNLHFSGRGKGLILTPGQIWNLSLAMMISHFQPVIMEKKSRERLLKSSCWRGLKLFDHLQGRGNSVQEQFLNDGEESNLNLNLIP